MREIAGSEIDGIQGDQKADGNFFLAEVMTDGIKLGCNYFTKRQRSSIGGNAAEIYPDPGSLICDRTAAAAYAVKYIV